MHSRQQPIWQALSLVVLLITSSVLLPLLHALEHSHEEIPRHTETADHIHTESASYTGALPQVEYHTFSCVYCQPHFLFLPSPITDTLELAIEAECQQGMCPWKTSEQRAVYHNRGPPYMLA